MILTTTTGQTLTSRNPKRQLPKKPRLQKHRKLQSQLQRKQLQRRKRTLTVTTCREVISISRTWSQQGTDQVEHHLEIISFFMKTQVVARKR